MNIKEAKIILYCNNLAELAFAGVLHLLNNDNDNDLNILKEEALEIVLSELEKKDKIINEMAKEITEWTGTCPYDKYDWQDVDCEKVCEDDMKQCWIEYFTNKVEREGK